MSYVSTIAMRIIPFVKGNKPATVIVSVLLLAFSGLEFYRETRNCAAPVQSDDLFWTKLFSNDSFIDSPEATSYRQHIERFSRVMTSIFSLSAETGVIFQLQFPLPHNAIRTGVIQFNKTGNVSKMPLNSNALCNLKSLLSKCSQADATLRPKYCFSNPESGLNQDESNNFVMLLDLMFYCEN